MDNVKRLHIGLLYVVICRRWTCYKRTFEWIYHTLTFSNPRGQRETSERTGLYCACAIFTLKEGRGTQRVHLEQYSTSPAHLFQ